MKLKRGNYCIKQSKCKADGVRVGKWQQRCLACQFFEPAFFQHDPLRRHVLMGLVETGKMKPWTVDEYFNPDIAVPGDPQTAVVVDIGLFGRVDVDLMVAEGAAEYGNTPGRYVQGDLFGENG